MHLISFKLDSSRLSRGQPWAQPQKARSAVHVQASVFRRAASREACCAPGSPAGLATLVEKDLEKIPRRLRRKGEEKQAAEAKAIPSQGLYTLARD